MITWAPPNWTTVFQRAEAKEQYEVAAKSMEETKDGKFVNWRLHIDLLSIVIYLAYITRSLMYLLGMIIS